MIKQLLILPLVFLLCFNFGCQKAEEVAEEPAVDVEAEVSAIESLMNQVEKAFNEGDLDAYMATFADDAIVMPPGESALIGKEAIRDGYGFIESMSFDMKIFIDELEVSGDWAFHRSHWKGAWTEEDSGKKTEIESKDIGILKRQPDGSWKITHTIFNFTSRKTSDI
jgi:uncharacterized protein (TIGR02246 family)